MLEKLEMLGVTQIENCMLVGLKQLPLTLVYKKNGNAHGGILKNSLRSWNILDDLETSANPGKYNIFYKKTVILFDNFGWACNLNIYWTTCFGISEVLYGTSWKSKHLNLWDLEELWYILKINILDCAWFQLFCFWLSAVLLVGWATASATGVP